MTDPMQPPGMQPPGMQPPTDPMQPSDSMPPYNVRSDLMKALEVTTARPDLATSVYQSLGLPDPGVRIKGYRASVSELDPGDLVGWAGGAEQDGGYAGNLAVYAGNGEIIESFYGMNRRRKLDPNENTFGMPVSLPGDDPELDQGSLPPGGLA